MAHAPRPGRPAEPGLRAPGARPSPERAEAARSTIQALEGSGDVFATFFESAAIGLALADLSGRYVRVNPVFAELLGRDPEDLIGVPFTSLVHPEDRRDDEGDVSLLAVAQRGFEREQRYLHADGRMRWVLHGVTVVPDDDGAPAWFAVSAQDITERRRAEQELRDLAAALSEQAVRDPLTELANRSLLLERLRASLSRDARVRGGTGLLFLDLDGFKEVNDRHGHAVGDAVLRTVARRLCSVVRPSDTVARLGGDEFVVLVEAPSAGDLGPVVERVSAVLAAPMDELPAGTTVGASIGTAWAGEGDSTPADLLNEADAAMYRDKASRR